MMNSQTTQRDVPGKNWLNLFDATDEQDFFMAWMQLIISRFPVITEAVLVMGPANIGPFRPVALWPAGRAPDELLVSSCEQVIQMHMPLTRNTPGGQILAQPVLRQQDLYGVFAISCNGKLPEQLKDWLTCGMGWLLLRVSGRVDEASARLQERLMTALDLMLSTMSEGKWQSASQAAATELAIRLGCDRVSVGFGDGNGVRFTALSHSADFSKRIDLVRAIEAAMNEAADQGEALWHSPMEALHEGDATSKIRITREHQILAREYGNPLIYSVPFFVSNEAYGVFLFEWASTEIDPVSRHLADVMPSILGRVLLEKREHQLPILQRLRRGFKHFQERLFGPKHGFFKLVTSLLILALIFFSVARGEFTLSAGAELEGGMIRVIASPYDAYVATALVRAGQTVRSGQVLATLDDRDLKLESSRWASQRLQYQKQLQDSEAQHDLAEVQITRSQIQQAAAQLYLVNQQLERATLRAPFDGIVVSGDLSQKLGGALHKGETLFEIAPLDSYRVVLLVNEEDISYVEVGQQGKLMLTALPGEALPFTTTLITPVAEAFEGKNSFRVEANLEGRADKLRPGMAGIGKLTVGQNHLIWIWTRQTTSWLRVLIWKWFGL